MNLDVRIKTTAEGQGAQQTADGLKKAADNADILRAKLAQAAQTNASLTEESDKVTKSAKQSAEAFKELFKAQEELSRATANASKEQVRWTINKQQAAQALGKLKESIPGLGTAINLLKNPYAFATGAIAVFVVAIRNQIAAQEEALRAAQSLGDAMDTGNEALRRRKRHFNDLEDAAATYEDQLRQLADEENGVDAQTKARLADVERGLKQERRAGASRLELEEAKIDAQVKAGKLSPERGEIARQRLRRGEATRIEGLEAGAQEARLDILRGAFEEKEKRRVSAEAALPAAQAEAVRLSGVAASKKGASESIIAATQAEIAKVEKERARAEFVAADAGLGGPELVVDVQTGKLVPRQEGISSAQAMSRAKTAELASLRQTLVQQQESPALAERQAAQAQARVEALRRESLGARRGMLNYLQQGEAISADVQSESTVNMTISRQAEEIRVLRERMSLEEEAARLRLERETQINKTLRELNVRAKAENGR